MKPSPELVWGPFYFCLISLPAPSSDPPLHSENIIAIRHTVCPGSSDPFYLVTYYIKRVTTPWTYRMKNKRLSLVMSLS